MMTQHELARRAGVDPSYVHRIERDPEAAPSRDVVRRLADALELSELDRATLFVAAGYWPWTPAECGEPYSSLAVAVALAVVLGDVRPLARREGER